MKKAVRTSVQKKKTVLEREPSIDDLEPVVDHLNLKDPSLPPRNETHPPGQTEWPGPIVSAELRRLVQIWANSGPNLQKMMMEYPDLAKRIRGWKTVFVPTETGNARLFWNPDPTGEGRLSPRDLALSYFMKLIINPSWEMLGGPCDRCDNYYVKKSRGQKRYCSRSCATTSSALSSTQKRRAADHEATLHQIRKALGQWSEGPRRTNWKKAVSRQTGVTLKWITRAVNRGDINLPTSAYPNGISGFRTEPKKLRR